MSQQITPPHRLFQLSVGYKSLLHDNNGHLYWIDLIRFLAAFAVLACHFRGMFFVDFASLPPEQQTPVTFAFYAITRLGHEAVLVFFVLSGFLVGGKALERLHNNRFKPRDYAIDRTVRIMLPLISALILAVAVNLIVGNELNLARLCGNLLSLQGVTCEPYIETLWSLSYEVWFYIIMCAYCYCIMNQRSAKSYIGLLTLTVCCLVFTKLSAIYLFIWIIGAMGMMLVKQKSKVVLYGSMLLMLVLIGLLQFSSGSRVGINNTTENLSFRPYVEILFGVAIIIFLVQCTQFPPKRKISLAINNIGMKLAAFSYTLYLTHIPVRDLLAYFGAPKSESLSIISLSLYVCWLIVALIVAYGVYYLFERNTAIVKRWIKNKLQ